MNRAAVNAGNMLLGAKKQKFSNAALKLAVRRSPLTGSTRLINETSTPCLRLREPASARQRKNRVEAI
jgi:hypothetical protein